MDGILQFVGPQKTVELFGIRLVGVNAETGKKLLFTIVFILAVMALRRILKALLRLVGGARMERFQFWGRQAIRVFLAVLTVIGMVSIWFNNPSQLASAAAFVTAGLAIASQRVIIAFAGYLIILRGKNFNVGDRIVMGGVRGDVIALGFMQTTIMEMGQPPGEQGDEPAVWVGARQYTGRISTVTNDKIFDTPVHNYTSQFPYIWEEMRLPVPYSADRRRAEQILLEAAVRAATKLRELGEGALRELERRYMIKREQLEPRVYYRLTDNWVEMTVRFVADAREARGLKDAIARDILEGFEEAGIGLASGSYEVVGMPELRVRISGLDGRAP